MSPECSPQSEMTAVQTHNATPNNLKDVEIKTNQLELNNNVSLSVMSDTNDPQSELLFTTLKIESSLQEAVVLETEAKKDTVLRVETSSIENGDNTAIQLKERLFSFNSTKTFNDSLIDKILMEQRVEDPLTKIDQTQAFDLECWDNSGSESVSSKGDDDEVIEKKDGKKKLEEERKLKEERGIIKDRQVRSLSEGAAVTHVLSKEGDVPVFPNLPDNALDALGLMASDIQKERLSDEEIEQKFKTLALAFSIDAVSIKERLERQQRQRDQAEDNLNAEIAKFSNAVRKLHPLCIDAETTELVTGLLDRLQLIVQASLRISTSAEIFGSVQQEWRIAESVNLMLSHLRNLVKQRDASRRQLQVTKRMLQETTSPVIKKPQTSATTRRLTINTLPTAVDGRTAPPRRASIAVIPRPQDSPSTGVPAIRRVAVRRISEGVSGERQEPLLRHWDCRKALEWSQDRLSSRSPLSSRPSRLEINPELTKIQEGSTESFTSNTEVDSSDENIDFQTPTLLLENPILTGSQRFMLQQHTTITNILKHYFKYYGQIAMNIFNHWAENGTLHEICFIGTIFCFAMATIFLCSTIMEIELARLGARRVPWKWVTWEEFFSFLYSIINSLSIIKTIH